MNLKNPFPALLGVALVVSIAALDSTIVGTTLPRVAKELNGEE